MCPWVFAPHEGGNKIPVNQHSTICKEVDTFSKRHAWYPRLQLKVRFKSQFCYIDTLEGADKQFPLCRLRYFSQNRWSLALFTYSNERYEPCVFSNGDQGSITDALIICEPFIM